MEIDLSTYREKYNTDAGHAFEYWCKDKLEELGYTNVEVTQGSGDFGVDLIAFKDEKKYGIQCKYYNSNVGNKAVMEAFSGSKYYDCDCAMLITNSKVTDAAKEYADKVGVIIYSEENINQLSEISSNNRVNEVLDFNWFWNDIFEFYKAYHNIMKNTRATYQKQKKVQDLLREFGLHNFIGKTVKLNGNMLVSTIDDDFANYISKPDFNKQDRQRDWFSKFTNRELIGVLNFSDDDPDRLLSINNVVLACDIEECVVYNSEVLKHRDFVGNSGVIHDESLSFNTKLFGFRGSSNSNARIMTEFASTLCKVLFDKDLTSVKDNGSNHLLLSSDKSTIAEVSFGLPFNLKSTVKWYNRIVQEGDISKITFIKQDFIRHSRISLDTIDISDLNICSFDCLKFVINSGYRKLDYYMETVGCSETCLFVVLDLSLFSYYSELSDYLRELQSKHGNRFSKVVLLDEYLFNKPSGWAYVFDFEDNYIYHKIEVESEKHSSYIHYKIKG